MNNYYVVSNAKILTFETIVRDYLKDGWICQGGVSVVVMNGQYVFFQAMIREG